MSARFGKFVVGCAALGSLGLMASTASAATSSSSATADLGDLDASGSGTVAAFDPALGTLTQVDISVVTTMTFEVCQHNANEAADSAGSGTATGSASITFPASVVSAANGSMSVPAVTLAASDGGDACSSFADGGAAPANGGDTFFRAETDSVPWSQTITDAAALAEYIGPGTIPFSFEASSMSTLAQTQEWTKVFLANGSAQITITYTYTPTVVPTTVPGETTVPGPTTTVAGATTTTALSPESGGTTTTLGGTLPKTGGSSMSAVPIALGLLAGGAAVVLAVRRRRLA